ncbi:hypothetical protein SAMN05421748_1243 [Paractinoplanes atraurantiacus]|uniref:Uncharacterized protein n=1 Tax=Paractinoplanes atraurantiacus TaxID=1036182 RepID=A0A285JUJ2_9ACTN|nr:hypothetical protein SAMN05421748_1243 [Actinoplanes atraurantiacus]
MEITRRLGLSPRERGSLSNATCPDIFELSNGDFAVIGTDMTQTLDGILPADAARADHERIVVVSRETLIAARRDIPEA